jgi:thioredoxin reductase (NADPH)
MYDLIIIGAGPAGMAAAIYAARCKLNTLVISKAVGGYAAEAHKVDNYPGFTSISGFDLMEKFREHVKKLGIEIKEEEVAGLKKETEFLVETDSSTHKAKAIILALGTEKRKLDIEGEEKFLGKGISYCAVCDSAFFKNKVTAVVGGSDAAANAALMLAECASKVYLIYRKENIRAKPALVESIEKNPKIEIIIKANIKELKGENFLEAVELDTGKELKIEGLFIEIGAVPSIALAKELGVKTDKEGYIIIDSGQKTNVEGVYAAGDITTGSNNVKQIITAASEGTIAALSVFNHIKAH